MTSRPSTAAPILAVLAIVLPLIVVGLYLSGYFLLGKRQDGFAVGPPPSYTQTLKLVIRDYPHRWQAQLFAIGGMVETQVTGVTIQIQYSN